ncbi:MAG: metallophosphoesterase [Leptospiraceae bacterium]|nr:metallophosphoesterase [Leptospiraceae bacterium]MCK6380048.1 metallophosphoesterase [Leptospiraceae bacterium]NUM40641.1 metallophosphoesterase [Leptospiraceae bacterium]
MKIALFGDIHGFWNNFDVKSINESDYDLVLFTGDLKGFLPRDEKRVSKNISQIKKKSFIVPGNWDSSNLLQLIGEIRQNQYLIRVGSFGQNKRFKQWEKTLGEIQVAGYSSHSIGEPQDSLCLIAGRPFSMGGNLSFSRFLKENYNVSNMSDSENKLKQIIDTIKEDKIIFLSHNGASGLGVKQSDIYGCDFKKEGGDWGDVDLHNAIKYATSKNKKVLGVFSGHMHHKISKTDNRIWSLKKDNILYINAAKVPRIFKNNKEFFHHHVKIIIEGNEIQAEEILWKRD